MCGASQFFLRALRRRDESVQGVVQCAAHVRMTPSQSSPPSPSPWPPAFPRRRRFNSHSMQHRASSSGVWHRASECSAAQESGIGLHCASECSSGMWHRPAPLHPDATAMHCVSSKPLKTQVHVHISLLIQCSTAQKSVQKNSKLTWTPSCFVAAASCTFFSRLLFRLLFVRLLVPDQARGSLHAN